LKNITRSKINAECRVNEFNFILSLSYLPFWLFVCFILGNVIVILQQTSSYVSVIFENIPVKIEIYKKNGGFDSIINLCNLIIFQISTICLIAIVWLSGLINIKILELDINAFLREPISIVLLIVIIVLMLWLYFMPMLVVIKKYQQMKNEYIEKVGTELKMYHPSSYECNVGELQKIQFEYNLVNSLPDWPTNIRINLIISLAIPIISWALTYFKS